MALQIFDFYRVRITLIRDALGSQPQSSISLAHIRKKASDTLTKLNKLLKKKGATELSISSDKELAELTGLARTMQAQAGDVADLPTDHDELLVYIDAMAEKIKSQLEAPLPTTFATNDKGMVIMSSHVLSANLAANLDGVIRCSPKADELPITLPEYKKDGKILFACEVRPVEEFLVFDAGMATSADGKLQVCERPIRFERMGKQQTAIAVSHILKSGASASCTLRVRKGSLVTQEFLEYLLALGQQNGLGQNRGSGYGQYEAAIEKIEK